jgi:hypothetical protein
MRHHSPASPITWSSGRCKQGLPETCSKGILLLTIVNRAIESKPVITTLTQGPWRRMLLGIHIY